MIFIDSFFSEKLTDAQQELFLFMDELLQQHYGLALKRRYKAPFYDQHSWVCYLNRLKDQGIECNFLLGFEIEDPSGVLEARGRKMIKGFTIEDLSSFQADTFDAIMQDALALDRQKAKGKK